MHLDLKPGLLPRGHIRRRMSVALCFIGKCVLLVSLNVPALGDDVLSIYESIARFSQFHSDAMEGEGLRALDEIDRDDWDRDVDILDEEVDLAPAAIFTAVRNDFRFKHQFRMRAEFEHQSGLMIAGGALCQFAPKVLTDLAMATDGCVPLVILVNDELELEKVNATLTFRSQMGKSILFIPHDTVWARDYGPTVLTDRLQSIVVDAAYTDIDRSRDDQVPTVVAGLCRSETRRTKLCIPGGNLLTNGQGLCVTTTRVQGENPGRTQAEIADSIAECYGAEVVAILEPLDGETTGHVDMFATFTDERTVVVGSYEHVTDPHNAAILDRNAAMLASIRIAGQKLRVVRLPMPTRREGRWPTFTNVVYANGRLLVPIYESTTQSQLQNVTNIYAKLLPGWEIRHIRVDDLICSGGALHCVVSNLGTLTISNRIQSGNDRRSQLNRSIRLAENR